MQDFDTKAYTEMKARHQAAFDACFDEWGFAAFSEEQFDEGMAKLSPKLAEGEKVVRFAGGCFIAKSRVGGLKDVLAESARELRDAMADPAFARGAFLWEMDNHEYCINWQADWDVCDCFGECEYGEDKAGGDYLREMGYGPDVERAYRDAAAEHFRRAEEQGWL